MVLKDGANWVSQSQKTIGDVTFDVYHNTTVAASNTTDDLLIQHGVQVQLLG